MSIISRELKHVRPQTNGTVKVQECLTDHLGRVYRHNYVAESEAAATTAMNARDMSDPLKDAERLAVLDYVRTGQGTPDDFPHVELTVSRKRRVVLHYFSSNGFLKDTEYFKNAAVWVAGLTRNTIANVLDISNPRAQNIKDRATTMISVTGMIAVCTSDEAMIDSKTEGI